MTHASSPRSGTHVSRGGEAVYPEGLEWGLRIRPQGVFVRTSVLLRWQSAPCFPATCSGTSSRDGLTLKDRVLSCSSVLAGGGVGVGNTESYPHSKLSSKVLLAHFPKVTCWINNDYYILMLVKPASKGAFFAPPLLYLQISLHHPQYSAPTRLEGKLAGNKKEGIFLKGYYSDIKKENRT